MLDFAKTSPTPLDFAAGIHWVLGSAKTSLATTVFAPPTTTHSRFGKTEHPLGARFCENDPPRRPFAPPTTTVSEEVRVIG